MSQIWGQENNAITQSIEKEQEKALKIINFCPPRTQTHTLFHSCEILKITDHITLQNYLFTFDFWKNTLPINFANYFQQLYLVHQHNTKSTQQYHFSLPQTRTTTYGTNSITYKSISDWNNIMNKTKLDLPETRRGPFRHLAIKTLLQQYVWISIVFLILGNKTSPCTITLHGLQVQHRHRISGNNTTR